MSDEERKAAWAEMRRQYKANIQDATEDGIKAAKETHRKAKAAQYRKQFKEDFPKYEEQIKGDYFERLAREDMKRIIAPFYPKLTCVTTTPKVNPADIQFFLGQFALMTATAASFIGLNLLIHYALNPPEPYKPLSQGILVLCTTYIVNKIIHRERPKDNRELTLRDYVECFASNPDRYNPRVYPNYKTKLTDELTPERGL